MVQWRNGQMSLCDGFWAREVDDLWPAWMRVADRLLEDEELIEPVYHAQGQRWKQSRTRGRKQTPAEVVLRMLVLKHANHWSFEETEQQVRANIVCREFARVGLDRVPDAKVIGKIAKLLGPEVVEQVHRRLIEVAKQEGAIQGRRLRVDTTVVETNIHYPTDSSLLGDGARVLTRLMKKVETAVGGLAQGVRDRMRTVKKKVVAIAISSRRKGPEGEKQRRQAAGGDAAGGESSQACHPTSGRAEQGQAEEGAVAGVPDDHDGGADQASHPPDQGADLRR